MKPVVIVESSYAHVSALVVVRAPASLSSQGSGSRVMENGVLVPFKSALVAEPGRLLVKDARQGGRAFVVEVVA